MATESGTANERMMRFSMAAELKSPNFSRGVSFLNRASRALAAASFASAFSLFASASSAETAVSGLGGAAAPEQTWRA